MIDRGSLERPESNTVCVYCGVCARLRYREISTATFGYVLVNLKPVSRRSKHVFRGHDRAPIAVLTKYKLAFSERALAAAVLRVVPWSVTIEMLTIAGNYIALSLQNALPYILYERVC
eukprot:sb/3476471/